MRALMPSDTDFVVSAIERGATECLLYDPPHPDTVARVCADADRVARILEANDAPVGHILIAGATSVDRILEIRLIVTTEPGRGYGRIMLSWALQHAFHEIDAHRIWLEVVADNVAARRLYESLGFVQEGVLRDAFLAKDGSYRDLATYGMLSRDFQTERLA